MQLSEFIEKNGLTMESARVSHNPHMSGEGMKHYGCDLTHGSGRTMTVTFSMGSAHTEDPTLADVLDCLASDAASVDDARSFEDWAENFGYDTDSRKAEATYDACRAQSVELKELIGDDYATLLYEVERL